MSDARTVVFAEEDTLFSLMAIGLTREPVETGVRALHYFFGEDITAPLDRLLTMGDHVGIPSGVRVVTCTDQVELREAIGDADVVVTEAAVIDKATIEAAGDKLMLIQKFGRDTRNIDLAAAAQKGIQVAALKRKSSVSSAEHVVSLIFALARRLLPAHLSVKDQRDSSLSGEFRDSDPTTKFNWTSVSGIRLLEESTLGLIGLGENSGEIAKRVAALGMDVVYYKRTRLSADEEQALGGARYLQLDALLEAADFVSVHVPYGPTTEKMVDGVFLAKMKNSAYLINSARGGVVDERALYDALQSKTIAGTALDVFRHEPVPADSPLLDLDEVLWTPHMAGGEPGFMLDEAQAVLTNIANAWRATPGDAG